MQPNKIFKKTTPNPFFYVIKIILLMFGICIQLNNSWAQDQSQNIWAFGNTAVLNFSSGNPISGTPSAMNSSEACAAVCDRTTGQLLFYTDAVDIWNQNNVLITTGTKLNGRVNTNAPGHSAQQGCLIVPLQGNPNRYYIFTVSDAHNNGAYNNNGLCFSIVDFNTTTSTNIDTISFNDTVPSAGLSPWTTPQLTAIPNCDGSYWIITHGINSVPGIPNTDLRAYLLTSAGLSAPVISTGFPVTRTNTTEVDPVSNGWMAKASPDGNKVAFGVHNYVTALDSLLDDSTLVYDFNRATGTFSNKKSFFGGSLGVAFSPNSQLLYTVNRNLFPTQHHDMRQHEISNGSAVVMDIGFTTGPKLGPDGRIYLLAQNSAILDVINNPNNIASSANIGYTANGLIMEGDMLGGYVLPNSIEASASVGVPVPEQNMCMNESDMKIGIHTASFPNGTYGSPFFTPSPGYMFSSSPGFYYMGSSSVWFSPAAAGPGAHTIYYVYADTSLGCTDTASCIINVLDTPHVNFPPIPDINLCTYNGIPVSISVTSNGNTCTLSGPGTDPLLKTFDPILAGGVGTYILTYTCTNENGCIATVEQTVTVINANYWHQTTMSTTVWDQYNDVTTDLNGNIYVVGTFKTQTTLNGGNNAPMLIQSFSGSHDATLLAKYDKCANLIWAARPTFSEPNQGQSIVLDELHNMVYIAGDYSGSITMNSAASSGNLCTSGYSQSISGGPVQGAYVAQYDMTSGCLYFVQDASVPSNVLTDPQSMAVNQTNGHIYVTGKYAPTPSATGTTYIKKYQPTLTGIGGNLGTGWIITSTGGASLGNDIDFDEFNNNNRVWVIGSFTSSITFNTGAGASKSTNLGNTDAFLVGYRDLGASVSLYKMFKGNVPTTATMTGEGVAINDLNGNPCITGSYNGVIAAPANPPFELVAPMNTTPLVNTGSTINAYMICMNFVSPSAWSRIVEANPGIANGYAVDIKNSRAYFTGNFTSAITIGVMSFPYVGTSGFRTYAASYNIASPATGPFANVTTSPSNGTHIPQAITTDNANHMFIVGLYNGTMSYLNGVPASGNLVSTPSCTNGFILRGDLLNGQFKMQTIEDETTENETRFSFTITAVPNPTTGIVEVWTDGLPDDANAEIEVSSLMGVIVYKGRLTSKKYAIDLSDLSAGTYILRVMYNGYPATARIIKI